MIKIIEPNYYFNDFCPQTQVIFNRVEKNMAHEYNQIFEEGIAQLEIIFTSPIGRNMFLELISSQQSKFNTCALEDKRKIIKKNDLLEI